MKKFKRTLIILLAIVMVFSLVACGGNGGGGNEGGDNGGDADTINVGAMFNLAGVQASLDEPSFKGFKLAADQINANGGINGKMINVVSYDGKTEQTTVAN